MNTLDTRLQAFQPISLAEMDAVKLQDRMDTKYVFQGGLLPALLEAMVADYRLLQVDGHAGTKYRSLYYDSADQRHYRDHHNRRTFRSKVRFREYLGSGLVYLEVKRKTGRGRTVKARTKVAAIPDRLSAEQAQFVARAQGRQEELVPSLWNHFTRYTFVNRSRPERLTLDVDLTFSDAEGNKGLGNIVVAELKQDRSDRGSPFAELMRRLGIRPAGMSKYCVGMLMLERTDKYNGFKEVLRLLQRLREAA